jgi:NAD(P)H-dependent FMN reductase
MAKILGISGSLRQGSYNASLLRAAAQLTPAGSQVDIASVRGIPLYDADFEAKEFPQVVADLKERIVTADGLLLVTPEYNNSFPGVFKNAIDWLARPAKDVRRVFGNRPVALMGATPTQGATILAQAAWLPVIRTLGMRPFFGSRVHVPRADKAFDAAGNLIDDDIRKRVQDFMARFVEFISPSR